jgi:hypothetical protein
MNALLKTRVVEEAPVVGYEPAVEEVTKVAAGEVTARRAWTPVVVVGGAVKAPVAANTAVATEAPRNPVKDVALFIAAPFIGLVYAIFMPLVGLAALVWLGVRTVARTEAVRFIAKAVAAPFVGLAFIVAMPFAGIAMLLWLGARGLMGFRA